MRANDEQVLNALYDVLTAGGRPWLCTIVGAHGSSPRPVGSLVAIDPKGVQTGSVSGGCVEEALVADLLAGHYDNRVPQSVEFGVSAEENEKLGLPCGGRLTILVQRLTAADQDWVTMALSALRNRQVSRRRLALNTGESTMEDCEEFESLRLSDTHLEHSFGPRSRILLVGAGQLAACIASIALSMDYDVLLTDSREWALEQWQGPNVEKLLGLPDDIVRERASDRLSAVMTLSHDPRVDDMALMEALETDAWYVGALGSLRTTEKRLQRLAALGVLPKALARLHAPIGIAIGSKTPMEIAVSVMAELTQLRRESEKSVTLRETA